MSETFSTESANVTVQRSPRYLRFFFVGVALGVIVALILTVSFPPDPQFSQTQVFGFLVIFTGAGGAVLGLVFALIVDRVYSRHVTEATAERTTVREAPGAGAGGAGADADAAPAAPTTEV
jgi:uncharacterized membrane protein (DUF485 family)